ncbi:hypothetical protein ACEZDB_12120 [Streptacidiphilus sp. N1-3]|uniref:Uncharacterized protein n=1 Tax=Streptacidiphilus alkalitolerans TaxID=3342712 RepID=A0ABV6WZB9_9ACTN
MAQHTWTLDVTDSAGRSTRRDDTTLTNPYISDETAQHIAEQILETLAPGYLHGTGEAPRELVVSVWREKNAEGDPLATARWSRGQG